MQVEGGLDYASELESVLERECERLLGQFWTELRVWRWRVDGGGLIVRVYSGRTQFLCLA